jgi:hypothetical protein
VISSPFSPYLSPYLSPSLSSPHSKRRTPILSQRSITAAVLRPYQAEDTSNGQPGAFFTTELLLLASFLDLLALFLFLFLPFCLKTSPFFYLQTLCTGTVRDVTVLLCVYVLSAGKNEDLEDFLLSFSAISSFHRFLFFF